MLELKLSVLIALIAAGPAPENLLVNPDFDADLTGWQTVVATEWDPEDVEGSPASGSARVEVDFPPANLVGVLQCVPILPGGIYSLRAAGLFPAGQPSGDNISAIADITWWDGPACSDGSSSGLGRSQQVPQDGQWHILDFGPLLAPLWAASADVGGLVVRDDETVEPIAHFDQFVFTGPEVVFTDTFESGGTSGWSAVIP